MHMDYLQIEKYRLAYLSFFFLKDVFLFPFPKRVSPVRISQSTLSNPDKDLTT